MASIKKNFAYNILLAVSQVFFPLVTFPYVTRVLGPESLGIVSFVDSFAGYFILIAALGIPVYGVREIAKHKQKEDQSRIFSEIFSIHAILTVFSLAIYFISVLFYPNFISTYQLFLWGGIMIFACIFIGEWYFQGVGEFKFIAIRTMLIRLVSLIFLFLFVKTPEDLLNYFLIIVFAVLINAIINFYLIRKRLTVYFCLNINRLKKHLRPMFYIFFSRASVTLFLFLDTIILGFLSSEKSVGIFSTALKVTKIPILIVSALGVVLIPKLTESFHEGNINHAKNLLEKSVNFVVSVSIPILLFFITMSSQIIFLFAGPHYKDAAVLIQILSPIILIIGLSNIFSMQVLTPMGKDKEVMIAVLIAIGVCLLFDFTLIPIFAEKGAAITNFLVEFTIAIITFFFASKYMKEMINWKLLLKNIILGLPIILIIELLKTYFDNSFILLLLSGIIFLIYFSILNIWIIKNELYVEMFSKLNRNNNSKNFCSNKSDK